MTLRAVVRIRLFALALAVLIVSATTATPARADHESGVFAAAILVAVGVVVLDTGIIAGGATTGGLATADVLGGERPALGTEISAWIFGTLNAAVGTAILALAIDSDAGRAPGEGGIGWGTYAVGVGQLLLGAGNLAAVGYGTTLPRREKARPSLTLAPMVTDDGAGAGLSLVLLGW